MSEFSSRTEEKIKDINAWFDSSLNKRINGIQFCPRELKEGSMSDYISDAHAMLEEFASGNSKDITNTIL